MAKTAYPELGDNSPAARAQRETHWRRLVERWKASGLTKSVFCEREGISGASLHWWLRELARRNGRLPGLRPPQKPPAKKAPRPEFVPVQVVPSLQAAVKAVELVVAGYVVRVVPNFDPETLRRLLELLEGEGEPC
jgi:hypothetical protein